MHVTLKNVLYCPDLAFTLVSLTCCDTAGYSVLLKNGKCLIRDMRGTLLGQIPLLNGLYKVEHKDTAATANVVQKVLTLDELHHRMGHISPQIARKLIRDGVITGLEVDMLSQPSFCMACAQARPTCKPVPQKREGPRAMKFGEKVHFDVWGPANPQSYDGKEYFVSFTDNHNWVSLEKNSLSITDILDMIQGGRDVSATVTSKDPSDLYVAGMNTIRARR